MRVVLLNGSPKGDLSVTLRYARYWALKRPEVEIEEHHVAKKIRALEHNEEKLEAVVQAMRGADLVLWAFPLYILNVCSQYKRFIELLFERYGNDHFVGTRAATLSTSINFYDNEAHAYIGAIAEDLGMRVVGSYSAHMHDLTRAAERSRLLAWAQVVEAAVGKGIALPRQYAPVPTPTRSIAAQLEPADDRLDSPRSGPRSVPHRAVILTDEKPSPEISAMVTRFRGSLDPQRIDVSQNTLDDAQMRGPCLGCLKCGYQYQCSYDGKDGFADFYRGQLAEADLIVIVGRIHDRYLSSRWKQFFDRSFFNTHTPSLVDKQIVFLLSGPLSHLADLRRVLSTWMEIQRSHVVGFVSDEYPNAPALAEAIDGVAAMAVSSLDCDLQTPRTFLGIGGMKIFRDEIWGQLKLVFRADHKAYRRLGVYDFPQRKPLRRLAIGALLPLLRIRSFRRAFQRKLPEAMVMPLDAAIRRAEAKSAT